MKYRQGFVSNSSSSSYLIAYDISAILTDSREIAAYIDNNLRKPIMFKSDLNEGWDLFELDMHQKNFLLKHRKRFEKFSNGTVRYTDYTVSADENGKYPEMDIPFVQALTKVYKFYPYPYEWEKPEVDMSDVYNPEMTFEETMQAREEDANPELKEKLKAQNHWSIVKLNRQTEARKQRKEEFLKKIRQELIEQGANPDTLKVELIEVDNLSCDPDGSMDYEFVPRYFGLDDELWFKEEIGDPDLDEVDDEET